MINRLKKIICICGVTVFALTSVSMFSVVNAEDYVDENQGEVVYTTAPQEVYTEPIYTQSPAPTENVVDYTVAETQPVADNNYNNYSNDDYNTSNDDYNTSNYSFYSDDDDVAQNYNSDYNANVETQVDNTVSEETTPTVATNVKDIDDTELGDSDWDKIAKDLAKNKSKGSSSSPFEYIKNSENATGWEAFINNLNWASTLGLVSFGLALICIILFIVFTVKKAKLKKKGSPKVAVKSGKYSGNSAHAIIVDDDVDISSHSKSSRHGSADYGDDFGDGYEEVSAKQKKKVKQDTADIIIPNKYKR